MKLKTDIQASKPILVAIEKWLNAAYADDVLVAASTIGWRVKLSDGQEGKIRDAFFDLSVSSHPPIVFVIDCNGTLKECVRSQFAYVHEIVDKRVRIVDGSRAIKQGWNIFMCEGWVKAVFPTNEGNDLAVVIPGKGTFQLRQSEVKFL